MKQENLKYLIYVVAFITTAAMAHSDNQVLNIKTPELGRHMDIEFSVSETPTMNKPVPVTLLVKNNLSTLK